MIVAFILGAVYGSVLWFIAMLVARARELPLGGVPPITILLCGVAAAATHGILPEKTALPIAATLIGAIVCATVDARTGLIFDALSLCMTGVAGGLAIWAGRFDAAALAALVVGGAMLALYWVTGRRGIGLGDVKLSAALALGYGLQLSLVAIGSAFVIGAGYASASIGLGRSTRSDAIRFGPFIAIGAAVGVTANLCGYHW